jgi:hypothetical protein
MPSQIIRLPQDIVELLLEDRAGLNFKARAHALGMTSSGWPTPASLEIWITGEGGFISPTNFVLPALAVAPEDGICDFWPKQLSDGDVLRLLEILEDLLTGVENLTGHQVLKISEAIDRARCEPAVGPRPIAPLPAGSAWQQRLLSKAQLLSAKFAEQLSALDNKLASYEARNREADMDGVIARLDDHAHLGARLGLQGRADGKLLAKLTSDSRRGTLAANIDAAQAHEQAAFEAHRRFAPFGFYRGDPDLEALSWLNRLIRGAPRGFKGFQEYRLDDPQADGLTTNGEIPCRVPAEAIPQALESWLDDMRPGRWLEVHPLVHATFMLADFMAIRPYQAGNGRTAGILCTEALRSRGMPALPWNLVIERHYESYQAALRTAVIAGQLDNLLAFMLHACELAIAAGDSITAVAAPERAKITLALEDRELEGAPIGRLTAYSLAEDLVSGVLVEGFTPSLEFVPMRPLLSDLSQEGYLDLLATPLGTWASVPSVRSLVRARFPRERVGTTD